MLSVISRTQIAELYGVSRQAVWEWFRERPDSPMPVAKIGGTNVYDLDAIIRWINEEEGERK